MVIAAYRRACEQAGREPGEIVLQGLAAAADSDDRALAGSREWKPTLRDEPYRDDLHDPAQIGALGQKVPDREFKMMGLVSADPATHVRKVKAMRALGATAVVVMNVSGADPIGTLRMYGEHVLPALRG
jgi:coenzyme F420-dependent glucose-6-phosphate dehydrogenase